jgi:hypothetical protein
MAERDTVKDKGLGDSGHEPRGGATRLLGSLRDALLAAGRDKGEGTVTITPGAARAMAAVVGTAMPANDVDRVSPGARKDESMKRDAKAPDAQRPQPPAAAVVPPAPAAQGAPMSQKVAAAPVARAAESPAEPKTGLARTQPAARAGAQRAAPAEARTQLVRGRQKVSRSKFHQDPVVAWLVVVGGPGLGAYRAIYEGNNTVGRAPTQRIPIDFGDDTISGEEQAYIRYDSTDRKFLFVPNLAKTNIVQVNSAKPTGAVELAAMDVITMGRTQLVFVPFCGPEFDWAELSEIRE